MRRNLYMLTKPVFLLGLLLLLANDFLFKPLFHNWLTGKLSDFAGLFIFPLFWTTFAQRRKLSIYLLTALGFIFWKSVYSQPLIEWWNNLPLFPIRRVIDSTDLIALAVLPLSYFYAQSYTHSVSTIRHLTERISPRRVLNYLVIVLSVFAFTATQIAGERVVSENKEYEFQVSKPELYEHLNNIGLERINHLRLSDEQVARANTVRNAPMTEEDRNLYTFRTNSKFCDDKIFASVTLHERQGGTVLKLYYLIYYCNVESQENDWEAIRVFEQDVINKLRERIAK